MTNPFIKQDALKNLDFTTPLIHCDLKGSNPSCTDVVTWTQSHLLPCNHMDANLPPEGSQQFAHFCDNCHTAWMNVMPSLKVAGVCTVCNEAILIISDVRVNNDSSSIA